MASQRISDALVDIGSKEAKRNFFKEYLHFIERTGDSVSKTEKSIDDGILNALYDAGISMNDVNPEYVIVGEGRAYSLDTLTKATNLVMARAKLIGANSDISGPIENGIAPAYRALISPIEMATGKQAYFCGKPNPLMMRTGLKLLGCHSAETVMFGDRMDTDVISGMGSGMSTVLVLSGISTAETLRQFASDDGTNPGLRNADNVVVNAMGFVVIHGFLLLVELARWLIPKLIRDLERDFFR